MLLPVIADARNFSGLVQLTYSGDNSNNEGVVTKQSAITQEYRLNYGNFVYDPRLLNFLISGTFSKEDGKTDDSETTVKGKDYDLRFNFLSATYFPFEVWTFKHTTASFTPQAEGPPLHIRQTLQSSGISGSIARRGAPHIRYSFNHDDRKVTGEETLQEQREKNFILAVSQSWKESSANLNYNFHRLFDKITAKKEETQQLGLSGDTSYKLSSDAVFFSNASFNTNTLADSREIASAASIVYDPSRNFNGSANASYNNIERGADRSDTYTGDVNAVYKTKISEALLTAENASVKYNKGESGDGTSESLGGSLSYARLIARNLNFSANTALGVEARQEESLERIALNSGFSTGLNKSFPEIRSYISTGGAVNYTTSTAGGKSENYTLNLALSCSCVERLNAQSAASYSASKTREDTWGSAASEVVSDESIVSDSSLTYFIPLGWRANLEMTGGTLREIGLTEKRLYYTRGVLTVILMRNLFVRSNVRYEHEDILLSDIFQGDVNVDYRIRNILVNLTYEWWQEKRVEAKSDRNRTFLQITRLF